MFRDQFLRLLCIVIGVLLSGPSMGDVLPDLRTKNHAHTTPYLPGDLRVISEKMMPCDPYGAISATEEKAHSGKRSKNAQGQNSGGLCFDHRSDSEDMILRVRMGPGLQKGVGGTKEIFLLTEKPDGTMVINDYVRFNLYNLNQVVEISDRARNQLEKNGYNLSRYVTKEEIVPRMKECGGDSLAIGQCEKENNERRGTMGSYALKDSGGTTTVAKAPLPSSTNGGEGKTAISDCNKLSPMKKLECLAKSVAIGTLK